MATLLKVLNNLADIKSAGVLHFASVLRAHFHNRFSAWAPNAQKVLKKLAFDTEFRNFRSAFFFGFYAFEDQFLRVPQFVAAHLNDLTDAQREMVARLALITRFSLIRFFTCCSKFPYQPLLTSEGSLDHLSV